MATKLWAIGLIAICTFLSGFAQVFFKLGSMHLSLNVVSLVTNYNIYIGIILYNLSFVLLLFAFKHGELSVLYPVMGLSYVWVAIFSYFLLHELITFQKIGGIAIILVGITFLGIGSTK